jgi:hypothetical protein
MLAHDDYVRCSDVGTGPSPHRLTRLVIDASTLLSGLLSNPASPPALILDALRDESFEAILCPTLISQVDHPDRRPPAIDARGACELLELMEPS